MAYPIDQDSPELTVKMKRARKNRVKLSSGERIIQSLCDAIAWEEGCETQARVTVVQVPIRRENHKKDDTERAY